MDPSLSFGSENSALGLMQKPTVLQTPAEALRTKHFWAQYITTILICWGLNVGIAYGLLKDDTQVGLWVIPDLPNSDTSTIYADFLITCAFVCFFTTLFSSGGLRNAVKKGKATPIADESLMVGIWRFFPVRMESTLARGLVLGAIFEALYAIPTLAILAMACESGALRGDDGTCWMNIPHYNWFKGFWAGLAAVVVYPFVYMGSLNRNRIPHEVYDAFLGRTLTREEFDSQLYAGASAHFPAADESSFAIA